MLKSKNIFERVNIEISNICNLKCSFCPAVARGKQQMSAEQFAEIALKIAPYTREVVLHLLGEPLAHPEFSEIIAAAESAKIPVNVVTNGVLLTGDRPKTLLSPGIRQVSFSLQSFAANFPDVDPRAYFRRIKHFVEQALLGRPDLYINLRFWDLTEQTTHDNELSQTLRALIAEELDFDWQDVRVDLRRQKGWRIRGRLYLHFDSRFTWPELGGSLRQEFGTCHALKGHIGIQADGTVVPCCLDHKGDIPLGNVFTTPIEDILSSPRATAMREGFQRGILVEDLCKTCGYIERFAPKAMRMHKQAVQSFL